MQVETYLEAQGMTPEEVARVQREELDVFLAKLSAVGAGAGTIVERFNSVIEQFWDVIDATSGEILLGSKALEAVNLLRKHIEAGCLSDPDGVALYYTVGKNAAGITTRRCVRGTNSTEVWSVYFTLLDSHCQVQQSTGIALASHRSPLLTLHAVNTRFHLLQRWCNVMGCLLNLTVGSCVADVIFMDLT